MRSRFLLPLLGALCLALAVLAFYQYRQIGRLHNELAAALERSSATLTPQPASLAMVDEMERLKAELADTKKLLGEAVAKAESLLPAEPAPAPAASTRAPPNRTLPCCRTWPKCWTTTRP